MEFPPPIGGEEPPLLRVGLLGVPENSYRRQTSRGSCGFLGFLRTPK